MPTRSRAFTAAVLLAVLSNQATRLIAVVPDGWQPDEREQEQVRASR